MTENNATDDEAVEQEEKSLENNVKEWAEQNFQAVKKQMKNIQNEMRSSKPQENINVRKVETKNGDKIVVEHSVQRWYSPKYFEKLLEKSDSKDSSNSDDDILFD